MVYRQLSDYETWGLGFGLVGGIAVGVIATVGIFSLFGIELAIKVYPFFPVGGGIVGAIGGFLIGKRAVTRKESE